jgi:hypothetical protein
MVEEFRAQSLLKRRKTAAERGMVNPQVLRANRELTSPRDGQKTSDQIPIERLAHVNSRRGSKNAVSPD